MATTFSSLPFVRRVAVGDCSASQGADATAQLARSAFEALGGADWTVDDSAPFIPVHEYKRPIPRGDAWKACYGYADSTRSQRSACGAVCYTFTLPADASTGSPCDVSSITASVVGDRYLDLGVDVHAILSDSSTPPTVAELLARTADATVCATSSQAPTKPNDRTGVTATLDLSPSSAATRYLHIALLLHDYLGVRGAWIEGGALLDTSTVAVGFSRDVAADTPDATPAFSLYRVIAKQTSVSSGHIDYTKSHSASFLYSIHFYGYTSTHSGLSGADARRILPLFVADKCKGYRVCEAFAEPYGTTTGGALTFQDDNAAFSFGAYVQCSAWYNPLVKMTGKSVVVPSVEVSGLENNGRATVRIGIVESDNCYLDTSKAQSVAADFIPWRQVYDEHGDALVGFLKVEKTNGTYSISIPILKQPTKDFLWLVFIPEASYAVNVQTESNNAAWRLDSN